MQFLVKNSCGQTAVCNTVAAEKAVVSVTVPMEAGAKKKKKKIYTTPKKLPHKNKKIKMRTLNFYKVEGDNIVRTRLECERCGAGCFMASHADRYTCGGCQRTLKKDL